MDNSVQVSFCPVTQLFSGLRLWRFGFPWCPETGVLHMKEIIIYTTIIIYSTAITTSEINKCKTYIYDKRFPLEIVSEMNGVTSLKRPEV